MPQRSFTTPGLGVFELSPLTRAEVQSCHFQDYFPAVVLPISTASQSGEETSDSFKLLFLAPTTSTEEAVQSHLLTVFSNQLRSSKHGTACPVSNSTNPETGPQAVPAASVPSSSLKSTNAKKRSSGVEQASSLVAKMSLTSPAKDCSVVPLKLQRTPENDFRIGSLLTDFIYHKLTAHSCRGPQGETGWAVLGDGVQYFVRNRPWDRDILEWMVQGTTHLPGVQWRLSRSRGYSQGEEEALSPITIQADSVLRRSVPFSIPKLNEPFASAFLAGNVVPVSANHDSALGALPIIKSSTGVMKPPVDGGEMYTDAVCFPSFERVQVLAIANRYPSVSFKNGTVGIHDPNWNRAVEEQKHLDFFKTSKYTARCWRLMPTVPTMWCLVAYPSTHSLIVDPEFDDMSPDIFLREEDGLSRVSRFLLPFSSVFRSSVLFQKDRIPPNRVTEALCREALDTFFVDVARLRWLPLGSRTLGDLPVNEFNGNGETALQLLFTAAREVHSDTYSALRAKASLFTSAKSLYPIVIKHPASVKPHSNTPQKSTAVPSSTPDHPLPAAARPMTEITRPPKASMHTAAATPPKKSMPKAVPAPKSSTAPGPKSRKRERGQQENTTEPPSA